MALKFQCSNCNNDIISKYLTIGDKLACPKCGAEVTITEAARFTSENSTLLSRQSLKTEGGLQKFANNQLNEVVEQIKKLDRMPNRHDSYFIDVSKKLSQLEKQYKRSRYQEGLNKVWLLQTKLNLMRNRLI